MQPCSQPRYGLSDTPNGISGDWLRLRIERARSMETVVCNRGGASGSCCPTSGCQPSSTRVRSSRSKRPCRLEVAPRPLRGTWRSDESDTAGRADCGGVSIVSDSSAFRCRPVKAAAGSPRPRCHDPWGFAIPGARIVQVSSTGGRLDVATTPCMPRRRAATSTALRQRALPLRVFADRVDGKRLLDLFHHDVALGLHRARQLQQDVAEQAPVLAHLADARLDEVVEIAGD